MILRINKFVVSVLFLILILNIIVLPDWIQSDQSLDDPINSVTEFVMEVCMDYEDFNPGDERNEEAPFSNYAKIANYYLSNEYLLLKHPVRYLKSTGAHIIFFNFKPAFFDITTPPPEQA